MGQERPPAILQIYRDSLKPGREAAFKTVEKDAARICAELKFPHSHLAIESLSGPKEVWWLNAFDSEAEKQRVASDYARNPALVAALEVIARRKEGLTEAPVNVYASYRADLSRGAPWKVAGARFFVVSVTKGDPRAEGPVFEAPDDARFCLRPVATRGQADVLAAAAGPDARIFAVRPYWGMPAREWIAADRAFWKANPMARVSEER
jgi:hypothetical protein